MDDFGRMQYQEASLLSENTRLTAQLAAVSAERDEWKRINQSDNQCAARRLEQAESERDALAARLAASEAAFERAVTIPVKHPRFGDDVVDSCWLCGGIGAEDHHYHGPIVHRSGCVLYRAALAAASEGE